MGDTQVLQRGNRVTIGRKGQRTETPLEEGEVDALLEANARSFGSGLKDAVRGATIEKMQKMPNRRDKVVDDATGYAKGGKVDGCAQRGKTKGTMR